MKALLILLVLAPALLSGCTASIRIDYEAREPILQVKSDGSLALAVHDRRSYIVSGDKVPQFVGLQRGGFGNPFDVWTLSDDPFADDFADTAADALRQRGLAVEVVSTPPAMARATAVETLLARKQKKSVLISITEWKSDTYVNVNLAYDLSLEVFNSQGATIAESRRQGREKLGGHLLNAQWFAEKLVPEAFEQAIKELFDHPDVVSALN